MEIDGTVWYSRHPWHHLALGGICCKAIMSDKLIIVACVLISVSICYLDHCISYEVSCFSLFIGFPLQYSLYIVKEVVSDIDTVSKHNFDHYLFAIKFIKYSQYILLQKYISRWIYLHCFYIFKLNLKEFIYSQSLKYFT